jgi:arylsulfatase A
MIRYLIPFLIVTAFLSHIADARQPNIILIMADDLGYETLGCNGGESYKTPNLDALAAGGMRFERCNVQPVCTPTRIQLMTGMYNVRNYIEFGVIDPKAVTFGHLFQNAGYGTCITGKWQLGRVKDLPQRLGFDEACLWQHMRRPPRYANPGLEYNGEERDFTDGEYGPDLVSDFALDFITRHKDKPFFLYYPMMLTHGPYLPTPDSPDWDPKAMGEKEGKDPKHFADMVAYMDKLVGRLVNKLDELGIRDNTLVLFTGDNGTGKGTTSRFKGQHYKGGKGATTARGMHVPMVANWPGRVPAGKVNDDLIDSTDFLPTICEAAGVTIPASLSIDGHSFWPQLKGEKGQPREWIYTWYSSNGTVPAREFVTTKEYKLYRNGHFYDLTKDPFEDGPPQQLANLTGVQAAAAKELQAIFAQYADARPAHLIKQADPAKQAKKKQARKVSRRQRKAATRERQE